MSKYAPTIGLEIHAELKTRTKMFCNSKNNLEEKKPNVNVCSVCMGHPGTLPVINKEAVRHVLRVGVALGGVIADFTEFDRKNYFYPDIPKGYQISQYAHPLVTGGTLAGVAITRVHLEEDTARSIHPEGSKVSDGAGDTKTGESLMDFNRAGVPLMELVTEPVIHSAEEAGAFARELQLLLRYLGVSDADMEKGHLRIEANISLSQMNADSKADERGLLYEDISYKIRGVAFTIYNTLGSGHKEVVYQRAFEEELSRLNIRYEKEKHVPVEFKGKKVGAYQPDFIIDDKVILEIKALPFIGSIEKQQVSYYIKNSDYKLALIVNFGSSPIQIERVIYDTARYPRESASNLRESALGVKTEIKNLNSFRNMEKAVEYEIERQTALLEKGVVVVQETRGWDEVKQETFSQRTKEGSADYRYFPEPDLPKLTLSEIPEFAESVLRETLPELPWERREKLIKLGIKKEDADMYVADDMLYELFEKARISASRDMAQNNIITLSNYITSDIIGLTKKILFTEMRITPESLAELVLMNIDGELSSRATKDILAIIAKDGGNPRSIAEEKGLFQNNDIEALGEMIGGVISDNKKAVDEYMSGKESALQFLVGKVMQETKGSANPALVASTLKEKLSK